MARYAATSGFRCQLVVDDVILHQYDVHKDPHKNIALPDSLLSRFDLLFVVTDDVEEERDRKIADHVLRMHRYLPPGVEEGTPITDSLTQHLSIDSPAAQAAAEDVEQSPFEKFDPLLHFGIAGNTVSSNTRRKKKQKEILSIAFLKKYLQYARKKNAPKLTKGAADYIVNVYATLRNEQAEDNQKRVSYPCKTSRLDCL